MGARTNTSVLAGGVFSNAAPFIQRIEQLVKQEQLPFQMMSTVVEPIGGAVVGGLKAAGVAITPILSKYSNKITQNIM